MKRNINGKKIIWWVWTQCFTVVLFIPLLLDTLKLAFDKEKEDTWGDPLGEFPTGKAAEPEYALYGKAGIGCDSQPAVDLAMNKGYMTYHIRLGGHAILECDWTKFIEYAECFLKKSSIVFI